MSLRLRALLASALLVSAVPHLFAQDASKLKPVSEGDGRIHGAMTMAVSEADLHPGQVQTINLQPRFHTVLEFPYPVARIDVGDDAVITAAIVGNKVTLKAVKLSRTETSMTLILGDANLTVVPFLVRADSTQPAPFVIRYTDPVTQHMNAAEAAIAARLQADQHRQVGELAELRLQQRLLTSGDAVRIDRKGSVSHNGESIELTIESAQEIPTEDGTPKLYLRYRLTNRTLAPVNDLRFALTVLRRDRHFLFFTKTTSREVYDVQDVRTNTVIPAGGAIAGLLVLDQVPVQEARESLQVEASVFGGARKVSVTDVLFGRSKP